MNRFVKPAVTRLLLADGADFIEVKRELNVGDQYRLEAAGMHRVSKPQANGVLAQEVVIDWEVFSLARVEVWLTGWSFRDDTGAPIPLSYAAIKALRPETFEEIETLISQHLTAIDQEKKQKAQTPASADATPSTS